MRQCFHAPVILNDSIYRKNESYYPKVFLETCCFIEDIDLFCSNSDKANYDEECI